MLYSIDMPRSRFHSFHDSLFWQYATLAMADVAVSRGDAEYGRFHYAVRSSLYAKFIGGDMQPRPLAVEEKLKLRLPSCCAYCGGSQHLSIDHLIPLHRGGEDCGENYVLACRRCNSSKGCKDVVQWLAERGELPTICLYRRYLKLCLEYARQKGLLELPLDQLPDNMPFAVESTMIHYGPPNRIKHWVVPCGNEPSDSGE